MTITGNTFKPEFFFVSPMEVVKVTTENMEQVAEWCGGTIAETESRRVKGRMDKYVWVPTPKGTKISWAFPGMYISKRMVVTLKDELVVTYSVFRKDYFTKNYFNTPNQAVEATWERADKAKKAAKKSEEAKAALKSVSKKNNGATLKEIMGEDTRYVLADIAGVPEVDDFEEAQGVVLTPEEIYHDGSTVVEDAQRETPHSPLPEPREAEEHERIAEEMEPASVISFLHDHSYQVRCADADCSTDRYVDGMHAFTDVQVEASEEGWRIIDGINISEWMTVNGANPQVDLASSILDELTPDQKLEKAIKEDEELDASKSGIPTPAHIVEHDQEQLRAARLAEYHKNKVSQ